MSILLLEFFQHLPVTRCHQKAVKLLAFCYLLVLGFNYPVTAQITITNSVFPVVGDTLHYAFGNQPGAINQIFTPPGGGQQWDLSNLQPTQFWDQIMKNPQAGSASGSFPAASILYNPLNSSSEVYLQVTGTQVLDMGYFGLDPLGLGLNLLFDKVPNLEETWAPVNFFDIHQSTSNVLTAFDAPIAPPILLNLVPTADSFRIRVTYQRLGVIDAYGTLAIPGGTFDVLRKKQTEYKSIAVDVKVAPLGWIDISTIGGQQILPLGTDTITTFHFLNDVSKEAIAVCTLNTAQNAVTGVQYKVVSIPLPDAGTDQTLCVTTPAQLNATYTIGTPSWSVVSGPSTANSQFSDTSDPQAIFTPAGGPGVYTLRFTVTVGMIVMSDDVIITFDQPITPTCPSNQMVCYDQQAFALTGGTPAGGTYSGPGVNNNMFNPGAAGIGNHVITYTAAASCGTNCMFTITVDTCSPAGIEISGTIIWETNDSSGVKNVNVALSGDDTDNDLTPVDGTYSLTASSGSNFTVTPTKSINKLNGVTTADATAIQQHVAFVNVITNPYKQVAADVNKSNSINSLDASIITQSLLGNPAALAQFKTSWRFVPVAHNMVIPPWGFPEKIVLTGVSGNEPDQDFFGVKTGDIVTAFANPANFGAGEPLVFNVQDQVLQSGAEVLAAFRANQLEDLAAFQFALRFDPTQLQLAAVTTADGGALPLTTDNFGLYHVSEGEVRAAWSQAEGLLVEEATSVFSLKFKALQSGAKLSEVLYLDDSVLPGYAYNSMLAESGVALYFLESTETGAPAEAGDFQLLQNQPNPFTDETKIAFVLPQGGSCDAQLRIFDATGRELWRMVKYYPAGYNAEIVRLSSLTNSGVLYYELTTPYGALTKRMLQVGK
ncbi:MAG: hypothetical protein EPGJADBJ_03345 [Saprospiraceae bacterium]|nr:hypothetical protein [Saprospiraceae bacterium]